MGDRDRVPKALNIFVVGAPRSGTTWVQAVLSRHPSVVALPETEAFDVIAFASRHWNHRRAWRPERASGLEAVVNRADYMEWASRLWTMVREGALSVSPAATRVLEKTPHHIQYLDIIREVCGPGGAAFVLIVRDPRDAIRSTIEAAHTWAPEALASDVVSATANYVTLVQAGLDAAQRTDTFIVRYEDLLAGEPAWRQLLEFLGLADMDLPDLTAKIADLSAERAVELNNGQLTLRSLPVPAGHSFHDRPADQHRPLSPLERRYIELCCNTIMKRFGYPGGRRHWRPDDLARLSAGRIRRKLKTARLDIRAGRTQR